MSAFTPGPWTTHPNFPEIVIPAADAGKGIGGADDPDTEAALYAKQISREHGTDYPQFYRSRISKGEAKANARLIAAAPELLATIKALIDGMDRAGGDGYGMPECPWCRSQREDNEHAADCDLLKARAAIAKAEGHDEAHVPATSTKCTTGAEHEV